MLQLVFGLTNSVLSIFFKFSMSLLFRVLTDEQYAKMENPSCNEINAYKETLMGFGVSWMG